VRAWTELTSALAADVHPDPDALLRYVDAPGALSPKARHAIAEHLGRCAACRDEARTLRTFDPLAEPAPARKVGRRFGWPSIGRIVWSPAFAYAVALVAGLYPLLSGDLVRQEGSGDRRPPEARGASRHDAPEAPPAAKRAPAAPLAREAPATGPAKAKDEVATPARQPTAPPPASAPAEPAARLEKEADRTGGEAQGFARAMRLDDGADALGKAAADGRIVLHRDAEGRAAVPANGSEVALAVADAPGGVDRLRLADDADRRLELPWRGGEARIPAAWLRPGRYTVELLAAGRVVATARFRIDAP
jgi:hypothetical protein